MTHKHYYLVEADGHKKGPFVAREIVTLLHQGLVSGDDAIQDEQGVCFPPHAFGAIGDARSGKSTAAPPVPPPLPKLVQTKEPHPTALVGTRRAWILLAALGLLKLVLDSWKRTSKSKTFPDLPDSSLFGPREEVSHEP